jgi:hypothetical protein
MCGSHLGSGYPLFETDDARSLTEAVEQNGFRRVWLVTLGPLWGSYENELRMRYANHLIMEVERSAAIVFDWSAPGTRLVLFDFSKPAHYMRPPHLQAGGKPERD